MIDSPCVQKIMYTQGLLFLVRPYRIFYNILTRHNSESEVNQRESENTMPNLAPVSGARSILLRQSLNQTVFSLQTSVVCMVHLVRNSMTRTLSQFHDVDS